MELFTIGFTKSSAESFFSRLREAGVTRVVDVRISNTSQLSGFAKRDDLAFFLRELGGIEYEHRLELAPSEELFKAYRGGGTWEDLESGYRALLRERAVETSIDPSDLDGAALLCSEAGPEQCHRRLAAEHLAAAWSDVTVTHL
jgi:uncharacterized protein (DUF488 family)